MATFATQIDDVKVGTGPAAKAGEKVSAWAEAKFQGRVVRTLVAGETVFPFG